MHLGDPCADRGTDLLGVSGGGNLARADRPHRLIGDHEPGNLLGSEAGQGAVDLRKRVLDVFARLADLEALTDAHDRHDAGLDGLAGLGVDQRVDLPVVLTALGVPDDRIAAAEFGEH